MRLVFSTMSIATRSWPMLWLTPPAILIPMILNPCRRLNNVMTRRLREAPARLYAMLKRLQNRKPITRIRIRDTRAASFQLYRSSMKRTARFASPSLMPGMPAKTGIKVSMYPKIIATAEKSPRYAIFLFIYVSFIKRVAG